MTETGGDPRWRAAALAKGSQGAELMRRYGAHGLGVAWVDVGDGPRPGLVLVVSSAPEDAPPPVRVEVDGEQHVVPVAVQEAPPDRLETAGPR